MLLSGVFVKEVSSSVSVLLLKLVVRSSLRVRYPFVFERFGWMVEFAFLLF